MIYPVTLAMIVKNGGTDLARCLDSARPWVSEIIVGDTGSTDDSQAIARSFGAKVIEVPWTNDFASARNAVLEHATSPWILVLDCDEALATLNANAWSNALSRDDVAGYYLRLCNVDGQGATTTEYSLMRLFRRHPALRYRYPIHEQISSAVVEHAKQQGLRMESLDVSIQHFGYSEVRPDKLLRNLAILEAAAERDSRDPFIQYNLGKILCHEHFAEYPRASAHLERARQELLKGGGQYAHTGYQGDLYHFLMVAAWRTNSADAALVYALEARRVCPDSLDLLYDLAVAQLRSGKLDDAIASFKACLARRDEEKSATQAGLGSYLALDGLGQALCLGGRLDAGIQLFQKAVALAPHSTICRHNLAQAYRAVGRNEEALLEYQVILSRKRGDTRAYEAGLSLLEQMDKREQASAWKSNFGGV